MKNSNIDHQEVSVCLNLPKHICSFKSRHLRESSYKTNKGNSLNRGIVTNYHNQTTIRYLLTTLNQ